MARKLLILVLLPLAQLLELQRRLELVQVLELGLLWFLLGLLCTSILNGLESQFLGSSDKFHLF